MAKRSKKRGRSNFGAAQQAMGRYIDQGASKVSDGVTTFLASFDTAELLSALKKQAQTAGVAAGRKVGLMDSPARRKRKTKRKTAAKTMPMQRRKVARRK